MRVGADHVIRRSIVMVTLALFVPDGAAGQITSGTIVGVVVDAQARPISRVEVRIVDLVHRLERTAETDDSGLFRVTELPPATYEVSASAHGFRSTTLTDVAVRVDTTVRVSLQLLVGGVTMAVTVDAAPGTVQTSSGLGSVFDRGRIEALPLNGRNFLQLALLAPGVLDPAEGSELSSRGAVAMHVNGAREESNNFLLDGVDNNDVYVNRYVVQPAVDSVQEFKIATNGYSAEYGRNAGGQVNVITRRGSDRFEGFLYEYFRNRDLDSRSYFDARDDVTFTRNEFGGGAGGPLFGDRTFFFGTLNLLRQRQASSRLGTVPTDAERRGDLSGLGVTVFNPFTRAPFPGNLIPSTMISPLARQVLAMFPESNRVGSANYLGQPIATQDVTQGNVRVDYRFSGADALMIRYSDDTGDLLEPYAEGTSVTAGYGNIVDDRTWNATAQYQRVFGAAVNSLRLGMNGFSRDVLTENHATDVGAAWGVSWLQVSPESFGYPVIDVAGYTRVGDPYSLPILRESKTFQVVDDLAIDRGNHLLKAGGEFRHLALDSRLDLFSRGQLSFTGALTGSGIGDLLLGLPTLGIKSQADNPIRMRTNAFSAYVQDEWRIRPDLTVNLGARYEYIAPPVDALDGMTAFDPVTGVLTPVGTSGVSRSGITPDRNNVAPRLAASWHVAPSTVVQGGYGVFYDSGMFTVNTAQYFNPPQFNLRVFFPSAQGLLTLDDPFPLSRGIVPPPTVSALGAELTSGYLHHWNVAVQREIGPVGTVMAAYAGSKGSHLIRTIDLNQPTPGPGDPQVRRPYPAFSNIVYIASDGRSQFNSLQLTLDRPLRRNVSLSASYTLSKSMDDGSAFLGTPTDKNFAQNSHDPDAEWAPSSFDVRHRLALSYIVLLPSGNPVTRNMQIQGITVMRTGQPFSPVLRFDNSNTGNTGGATAGSDRPNLVGDPKLESPTPDQWFNTSAFAVAAPYTFGSAGRNSVRGPGFATFDVAVSKDLQASPATVTLAVQVFNVFNRTNFDQPEHFVDEPASFGRIFSAKAPRQVQLVARVRF